jgi:hypothetical protein
MEVIDVLLSFLVFSHNFTFKIVFGLDSRLRGNDIKSDIFVFSAVMTK